MARQNVIPASPSRAAGGTLGRRCEWRGGVLVATQQTRAGEGPRVGFRGEDLLLSREHQQPGTRQRPRGRRLHPYRRHQVRAADRQGEQQG